MSLVFCYYFLAQQVSRYLVVEQLGYWLRVYSWQLVISRNNRIHSEHAVVTTQRFHSQHLQFFQHPSLTKERTLLCMPQTGLCWLVIFITVYELENLKKCISITHQYGTHSLYPSLLLKLSPIPLSCHNFNELQDSRKPAQWLTTRQ